MPARLPNKPLTSRDLTYLTASFAAITIWSGLYPADRFTWYLEALPAITIIGTLVTTWRRFSLTALSGWLIWALCVMMLVGAHYTYSEVPLFNWIRDEFGFSRNQFDRISHLLQGVTVAIVARELVLRTTPIRPGLMLILLVALSTLGVSAGCELVEWAAAEIYGNAATAFLGMQGDVWDTQKDMALALIGAIAAIFTLRRWQDRQIGSS